MDFGTFPFVSPSFVEFSLPMSRLSSSPELWSLNPRAQDSCFLLQFFSPWKDLSVSVSMTEKWINVALTQCSFCLSSKIALLLLIALQCLEKQLFFYILCRVCSWCFQGCYSTQACPPPPETRSMCSRLTSNISQNSDLLDLWARSLSANTLSAAVKTSQFSYSK